MQELFRCQSPFTAKNKFLLISSTYFQLREHNVIHNHTIFQQKNDFYVV